MKKAAFYSAFAALILLTSYAAASDQDVAFLKKGVKKIGVSGSPGPVCVFGDRAFAVVAGVQKDVQAPLVAAAEYGAGRVVVFGHNGYLNLGTLKQADTLTFFKNTIHWTANENQKPFIAVYKNKKLTTFLIEQKMDAGNADLENLQSVNVLILAAGEVNANNIKALDTFVQNGGGVITAGLGWGWKQLNRGKSLRHDFMANQLLAPMGLVWADGFAGKTCDVGYRVEPFNAEHLNASKALAMLSEDNGQKLGDSAQQLSATLTLAIRSLPDHDTLLRPKIAQIEKQYSGAIIPSPKKALGEKDVMKRLLVSQQVIQILQEEPEKTSAHPAAEFFPGQVSADAQRIAKTLDIDTSVPRWHSTGLYAAPGEVITVRVDPAMAGKKLSVRIGAHKDKIWHHKKWKRCPEITRSFAIAQPETAAANAFGGLVYIEVPQKCTLGTVKISVEGAVQAPYYIHGKTDLNQWRQTIRNAPAPWAELATDKIIITVPSTSVRQLDDPAALMDVWDDILDACADLATIDRDRTSPERIVPDVQISAGYMHSGYPIMTLADQYVRLVDREHLLEGNWGLFHELGHNHQNGMWTFGGTGEVTVNLFTTYVFEKVCDTPPAQGRVPLEKRAGEYEKYVADGRDFEQWKKKPFLALVMYLQLQEQFGWEPYQQVFAEYRALPDNQRPKTDDDKRDQWMVRFSKTVGYNLGPFFDAWNVPVSEEAKKQVADLPVWLPKSLQV